MKSLTLRYQAYGKGFVFKTVQDAIKGKGKIEDDVIYFNDIASMYKFLSPGRIELLSAIKTHRPHSLYELSQVMGKDQGYVSKEIKFLKEMGILALASEKKEGRECLVPVLKFDRIIFDVGIDELPKKKAASSY